MTAAEGVEDEEARFARIFREQFDAVLAYALARTDVETAKDAVADVFLVAWRRRREVPNPGLPWLLGVAHRTLADQWRSQRRQRAVRERIGVDASSVNDAPSPEEQVVERQVVLGALNSLGDSDRELLCLLAWDGLDKRAAAAVLECSLVTFAVRLHRARRRFDVALSAHLADVPSDGLLHQTNANRASPATDGAAL